MGLTEVSTPDELRGAIDARRRALGLSMLDCDHVTGLQSGYTAKLLTPTRIKNFGEMSMSALLGALGLRLVAIPTDAAGVQPWPAEISGFRPMDMASLLRALNMRLVLIPDDKALPLVTRRTIAGQRLQHCADPALRQPRPAAHVAA